MTTEMNDKMPNNKLHSLDGGNLSVLLVAGTVCCVTLCAIITSAACSESIGEKQILATQATTAAVSSRSSSGVPEAPEAAWPGRPLDGHRSLADALITQDAGPIETVPASRSKFKFSMPSFERYQKLFGKSYRSLSERLFRLRQFMASIMRVASSVFAFKSQRKSYHLQINQFSDLTLEEKRRQVGLPVIDDDDELMKELMMRKFESSGSSHHRRVKRDLWSFITKLTGGDEQRDNEQSQVDWRQQEPRGCLPAPTLDQGPCGCCYAIAILKLLEWSHCRQVAMTTDAANATAANVSHAHVKFSPQYIIDCGRPFDLSGCERGNPLGTFEFIKTAGLLDANVMPYEARERECPIEAPEMVPVIAESIVGAGERQRQVHAHKHVAAIVPKALNYNVVPVDKWLEELREQPLVVVVHLSNDFYDYGGGLYEASECDREMVHFMLLVGRGRDSKTRKPFWLLSNSFGENFGESGYMRVLAEAPKSRTDYETNCLFYALKASATF